jgi:hypothetical protein
MVSSQGAKTSWGNVEAVRTHAVDRDVGHLVHDAQGLIEVEALPKRSVSVCNWMAMPLPAFSTRGKLGCPIGILKRGRAEPWLLPPPK